MNGPESKTTAETLGINIANLPVLLDDEGIRAKLAPIGRTLLWQAATAGEIESVLLGAPGKRGKRLFVTASVVAWMVRRAKATAPPKLSAVKVFQAPRP